MRVREFWPAPGWGGKASRKLNRVTSCWVLGLLAQCRGGGREVTSWPSPHGASFREIKAGTDYFQTPDNLDDMDMIIDNVAGDNIFYPC